jgi:hypothetical protein
MRVIEQRKRSLVTHGVPRTDRAWVEAERTLVGNQQSLTDLRGELLKARQLT